MANLNSQPDLRTEGSVASRWDDWPLPSTLGGVELCRNGPLSAVQEEGHTSSANLSRRGRRGDSYLVSVRAGKIRLAILTPATRKLGSVGFDDATR